MSVLREAFVDELKDLFDAEKQLLKALPKMAEAAENDQLRAAFQMHEEETRQQAARLGRVFEAFDEQPKGKHCKGMEGLIEEAEELIEEEEGDAALIAAAQKAEHYEISAYGTLAAWAVALGQGDAAQTLNETLEEEKETDRKLTSIAQSVVNSMESQKEEDSGDSEESGKAGRAKKAQGSLSKGRARTRKSESGGQKSRRAAAPRSKRQSSRAATGGSTRRGQSKSGRAKARK